jgi:molybdenum cofactor biosynthesis enzyme
MTPSVATSMTKGVELTTVTTWIRMVIWDMEDQNEYEMTVEISAMRVKAETEGKAEGVVHVVTETVTLVPYKLRKQGHLILTCQQLLQAPSFQRLLGTTFCTALSLLQGRF